MSYSPQSHAQLQAMGIQIFSPIEALSLAKEPWIDKLCELLEIAPTDCLFDGQHIHYDNDTKKLHLPQSTYLARADIKKAIWKHVQPFVSQGS